MEARKITVVSTKTQKKSVIMSDAETLGELKTDLNEAGIDYNGMTFFEGTSKTELKTDESVLPRDVPYTNRTTGETINTNELVFMLTNTNKKIRSGAMTRTEAYNTIKAQGLQGACVAMYGKNFTQCSTNDLILLIQKKGKKAATAPVKEQPAPTKVETVATTPATPSAPAPVAKCVDVQVRAAITELTKVLCEEGTIEEDTRDEVLNILGGSAVAPTVTDSYKPDSASPYSDNEIDAMFRGMC